MSQFLHRYTDASHEVPPSNSNSTRSENNSCHHELFWKNLLYGSSSQVIDQNQFPLFHAVPKQLDPLSSSFFSSRAPSVNVSNPSENVFLAEHSSTASREKDASLQSSKPLHPSSFVAYFEMQIVFLPRGAVAAIGLGKQEYPSNKQPGWQDESIGYHSDDGNIFMGQGRSAIDLDKKFEVGDHVGCGVRWIQSSETSTSSHLEAFFTRNGKIVVEGIKRNFENIYPTIGLDHSSVRIIFNPVLFSFSKELEQMEWSELIQAKKNINSMDINHSSMRRIIREYLVHEGYIETLSTLDASYDTESSIQDRFSKDERDRLTKRNQITNQIAQGQIDCAIQTISNVSPHLFESYPATLQMLQYQLFIEYIREDKIREALDLLQNTLSKYEHTPSKEFNTSEWKSQSTTLDEPVQSSSLLPPIHQVAGLIAYQDPMNSPLRSMLHQNRRQMISDVVKGQLKVVMGFSKHEKDDTSVIERLMKQLLLVFSESFSPSAMLEEGKDR